ncbi:YybH family protein [Nonomuraea candida]|uniref:YybH family protein n=1 Tax=Nonomuraea candida TaxID=359159 RepID=UPI0005BC8A79|nr:nuclear transport factor 2 family protein [Nonomuraea candida]
MTTRREKNEAEIRGRIGEIVEGLRAKDLEALKRLYSTDIVSFDIESPLQDVGIEAKLRNWAKVFTLFERVDYELRDLTLTVGDEVAFGHAFGRLSGTLAGGPATGGTWVRVTFGFRKIGGAWWITHDQVSLPIDIQSGRAMTGLEP